MKGHKMLLGACLAALPLVQAFPTSENVARLVGRGGEDEFFRELARGIDMAEVQKRALGDPLSSPIKITGSRAFQPPGPGDQRGPCPGLNALANHGYLSRDGVVGFADLIVAVNSVYGMGIDLITILAIMGTLGVGAPLSKNPGFSIGGVTAKETNILNNGLGLLGQARGLDAAHNWLESDASFTRDDLYQTGNAWTMNMTRYLQMVDAIPEDGHVSIDDIGSLALARFHESIGSNPYFYYGPYTGMVARNAGYMFMGRLLSNHTADFPTGGRMSRDVFASFFGVSADGVYNEGHERIPDNWYRIATDYSLIDLNIDLIGWLIRYPELATIGGNLGRVNTFAGLHIEDVTGGVLGAASLLEGNNLLCFGLEVVQTFAPNALSTTLGLLAVPLSLLEKAIATPLLDLGCPNFKHLTAGGENLYDGLKKLYPGAAKSGFAL